MARSQPTTRRAAPPAPATPAPDRRYPWLLAAVLLGGLGLRLIMLADYTAHSPLAQAPLNDARTYWEWAGRIAAGQLSDGTPFFSAPLYPFLLGGVRALGGGLTTVYLLQIIMDLATAALLARLARRRFGPGTGLLAAALFLSLLDVASASLRVLTGSLELLLVTLTWTACAAYQARPDTTRLLALGGAVGLLCLAFAPAMLLLGLLPLWLLWERRAERRPLWPAVLPTIVALIVIAPATLHNRLASGEWFLIRSGGGVTLAQGNQPHSTGVYTELPGISTVRGTMHADAAAQYTAATGQPATWRAVDRYYRDQVLGFWTSRPGAALTLFARKAYGFFTSQHYADIYRAQGEISAGLTPTLRLAPLATPWLLGAALVGLIGWLRRDFRGHLPALLLAAIPLVTVVLFFYSPRYRAPALPVAVVAAAWALAHVADWRKRPAPAGLAVGAVLAGLLTGPVNRLIGYDVRDPSFTQFNRGAALYELGRVDEAVAAWQRGLAAVPSNAARRVQLADMLARRERFAEAAELYGEAARLRPADAELHAKLGQARLRAGQPAAAATALARAVELDGDRVTYLTLLADARRAAGEHHAARVLYEQALKRLPDEHSVRRAYAEVLIRLEDWPAALAECTALAAALPDDASTHYRLGSVRAQLGDLAGARAAFERTLTLAPGHGAACYNLGVIALREERLDDAAKWFRRTLAASPDDAAARQALQRVEQLIGERQRGAP